MFGWFNALIHGLFPTLTTGWQTASLTSGPALTDVMRAEFKTWLLAEALGTDPDVDNMVFNFHDKTNDTNVWIYPRLSAERVLWHLRRGETAEAVSAFTTALTWQQLDNTGVLAKSYGAWPSLITEDPMNAGEWIAAGALDGTGNPAYYSGDGLVILEALCALYDATANATYRTAAILLGNWLTLTMIDDVNTWLVSFGYAGAPYPAPFQYVDHAGNYSDRLQPTVEYCWIGALTHLSTITGDSQYGNRVAGAVAFYQTAQHASGYYYDHKSAWPNYPNPPVASAWLPFNVPNSQVLADNVLNAALGAVRNGEGAAATACWNWLQAAVFRGGVPGYLSQSGGHGFPPLNEVYYDVVASGQYRSLCQWLNKLSDAQQTVRFIEAARNTDDHAWLWGILKRFGTDATGSTQEAPHTGFWATEDLSYAATAASSPISYLSLFPTKFVSSVAITPAGTNIPQGTRQFDFTVTYTDATFSVENSYPFFWSDDEAIMTVGVDGLGTTVGNGAFNMYGVLGRRVGLAYNVVDP